MKAPNAKVLKLIREMLAAFDVLGRDPMARIDSRACHKHFMRRARKLRIIQ